MRTESSGPSEVQFGEFERVRRSQLPLAAMALLLALGAVEATVARHRVWFADAASWTWETKTRMIREGAIDGDVAIVGTSILMSGIDPAVARQGAAGRYSPVNLAHLGMTVQAYAQTWEEFLSQPKRPRLVFVELREFEVTRASWIAGPYFSHEASWSWFLASGVLYFEPSLLLTFAASRALPSFSYRQGLVSWLSRSWLARRPMTDTRDRNLHDTEVLRARFGFSPDDRRRMPGVLSQSRPRPWRANLAGRYWFNRFLDASERSSVEVVLLEAPVPPKVAEDRGRSRYDAGRDAFIQSLRAEHPRLKLEFFAPTGFGLDDFYDDLHLTSAGAVKLSAQFSQWLQARSGAPGAR